MPTASEPLGWLILKGGPLAGQSFYPPDDLRPGQRVQVRKEEFRDGHYRVTSDGSEIVWIPVDGRSREA